MQSFGKFKPIICRILVGVATGLLLVAVACGAAATATPRPADTPRPPVAQVATPAPTLAAVATPVPKAAPTPTPIPAPAAKVHPGKLTIMVGHLSNERFDYTFGLGTPGGLNFGRIVGGFLISTNERTEMVPGIASRWGFSADGLTWAFTIRKGVKFHDGSELTPQDVLWTLQHHFGPQAVEYSTSRVPRQMDKIELSGPDKVTLTTRTPITELGLLVSEAGDKWYQVVPKRGKLGDGEQALAYDKNPIGAGPMRLEKHVPASVMKFQRFDDFYYQPRNGFPEDKRVNFQSLDMFLVPEEATRVAALRAGEADLVPASLPTKKQVEAGGGRLVLGLEGFFVEVRLYGCWERQYPCHDKRVRQALDYAIDKELIRDRLYGGPEVFQVKGWWVVTPSTIGYTPALDPWPFDPAKARQLMADAGYPGGKGFGKLILNTNTSTAMPFLVEAAQLAAEFWKRELGLDVEVKVGDRFGLRKTEIAGELNGQIWWRENEARSDATASAVSSFGDRRITKSPSSLHNDPELFGLVHPVSEILDPDERAEALKKLYLRLRDESYVLGIGYVNIPWGAGARVLTWRPYPLAVYPSALHTITLK